MKIGINIEKSHINKMHSNFPANLAISPSHPDSSSGYPGTSFSAQQDAIEKYGIAGRVW
jgi:hypothetical protein